MTNACRMTLGASGLRTIIFGALALGLSASQNAPQREMAREKKEAENTRLSQEKARLTNKAAFKP